jgi:hypothetical protein
MRNGRREVAQAKRQAITAELIAVIVAVTDNAPRILTVEAGRALPSGPFESSHRSLQAGLREWVEKQTGHPLGYLEQLYTFADRDRGPEAGRRVVSISYLGLTREARATFAPDAGWRNWYDYFPWEDRRESVALQLPDALQSWAEAVGDPASHRARRQRIDITFADGAWNEELVLQRYELLHEAGLVPEARPPSGARPVAGEPMAHDHRRILATGIARLRAKIKYRPVVFELMPPQFTLLQLQRTVEALAGRLLHKQNFRRLIEQQELVEETGAITAEARGRPAKLFRFRRSVLNERAATSTRLPLARAG